MTPETLVGLSDIRRYFIRNDRPIFFVSATCFNLIGMCEWVRRFRFINHIDCFDGAHANVLAPAELPHQPFTSIEDINNYLLQHKEVVDYIRAGTTPGERPLAVFLMFDEQTEALCEALGMEIAFPSAALRNAIDDKSTEQSTREAFIDKFLHPPLWSPRYAQSAGTLYTAAYAPVERALTLAWPDQRWQLSLEDFQGGARDVHLGKPAS